MTNEAVSVTRNNGVFTITLNRPHRLNAFSRESMVELNAELDIFEQDSEQKVLIVIGANRPDGRPCFSAGADLKEIARAGGAAGLGEQEFDIMNEVEGLHGENKLGSKGFRKLLTHRVLNS